MSLREEVELYSKITGKDGWNEPIVRIGAFLDGYEKGKEDAESHWIPVTENCDCDLMDNEEVLVFQKDGTINGQIRHAMFYDFNGKKKFVTWEEGITIYDVLAYMPLPEPYKGSDK